MSEEYRRKGYKTRADYDHACRTARKTKALALEKTKVRYSHWAVLSFVCHGPYQQFDSTIVTFTKRQVCERLEIQDVKTVKAALRALRAEGTLVPIKNWQGGQGVPTTYRIFAAGQGSETDAAEPEGESMAQIAIRLEREDKDKGITGNPFTHYLAAAQKMLDR